MAEDFMTAAVKRVEEQFAKSGVSESCAAFERKDRCAAYCQATQLKVVQVLILAGCLTESDMAQTACRSSESARIKER